MTLSDTKPGYSSSGSIASERIGDVRETFLLAPGAGGAGPACEIDAHELLNAALRQCRKKIDAKRLHVSLRLLAKRCRIRTDPDRLRRVFLNLLTTIIQKTEVDGRITIRSSCAEGDTGSLRVEVEKNSASQPNLDADSAGEEDTCLSINK